MKTGITLRPSSLSSFVSCSRKWFHEYIMGETSRNNVFALIGTGIHKGVEQAWKESIKTQKKDFNIGAMTDAAVESYDKEVKSAEDLFYDEENDNTARKKVIQGIKTYKEDIAQYTEIPTQVEKYVSLEIDHCIVDNIGGTIDYITENSIADIKTSRRKVIASGHVLQQSAYKYLANLNGYKIDKNLIQGIVIQKTKVVGGIDTLEANEEQMKYIVNNLLDRLTAFYEGTDPDLLFPGNPKHYLCNNKYCSLRATCPYVNGIK